MVSSTSSSSPPTITVVAHECRRRISLRQLAKDLNADRRNLQRAKNWLVENKHPSFEEYVPDSPLSPDQAKALTEYRRHTTSGLKGDALTEQMFAATGGTNIKKDAIRDLFERAQIPPEQAAQLTHSILEIFKS